jgi:hypothetical protein
LLEGAHCQVDFRRLKTNDDCRKPVTANTSGNPGAA